MEMKDRVGELMSKVRPKLKETWFQLYEKPWMYERIVEAIVWLDANPHRAPKKRWGQFLSSWFRNSKKYLEEKPTQKRIVRPQVPIYAEPVFCESCNGDGFVFSNDITYRCFCAEGLKQPERFPIWINTNL